MHVHVLLQKHEGGCPKTQEVIHAIYNHSKHLQPFVSTGVGNHQMMSCQFFRWTKPRQILSSGVWMCSARDALVRCRAPATHRAGKGQV